MNASVVSAAADFDVSGAGDHPAWQAAAWLPLTRVGAGAANYATAAKLLHSPSGLYVLVDCEDARLSCTDLPNFGNLFQEDVVELFLWPDESQAIYFEYEISPLGTELPIIVPNHDGRFYGWLPWNYDGPRRVRKATAVRGGPARPGAAVAGWSCEFFIPFALLQGLGNTPPAAGATWRANIYRIDYDGDAPSHWAWCPDTREHFHDFRRFGSLNFAPADPAAADGR